MKRILSVGFLFCAFLTSWAQSDKAEQELKAKSISDSAYQYEKAQDYEKADLWYRKAIQYGLDHELSTLTGNNYRYLGLLFQQQGRYDSSLWYYKRARPYLQSSQAKEPLGKLTSDIGNLLNYLGDFHGAIEQYIEASHLFEAIGQDSVNSVLFANLGYAFFELGDQNQSTFYNRKALQLARRFQMDASIGVALLNLGSNFSKRDQLDSAEWYYLAALDYARNLSDLPAETRLIANLAGLESKKGQDQQALQLARSAYNLAPLPDQQVSMEALLGKMLCQTGYYSDAEKHLLNSLKNALKAGLKEDEREIYLYLSQLKEQTGQFQTASQYLKSYIELSDSLQNQLIHDQSQRLTVLYETERKEKENQILKAENVQKAQELRNSQALSQRNLLLFILFACLFSALAIIFGFYRKHERQKRKLAEQAAEMNRQKLEQLHQAHQLQLMRAMLEGQESERNRLAKDLHDGLGGLLSTVNVQFQQVQKQSDALQNHSEFDRARALLQQAGTELRQIAHNLMPANLLKFGLVPALEDLISEINFSKALRVDLQCFKLENRLPEIYEISLYRIIQELVHNIIKHAHATEALVQLIKEGNDLLLTVEDNGLGIPTGKQSQSPGQGLHNIRSRVEYLDGQMDIHSKPGDGTSINITFELASHDSTTYRR